MNTPFSLFLALRYLKPKRSFVSIITVLSITGVVIGIAALIVVIAVMTGFGQELKKKIIGFEPHIQVEERGGTLKDWETARDMAMKAPGVTGASPIVTGPVLMEFDQHFTPARMLGVLLPEHESLMDIRSFVKEGKFDLEGDKCVMGRALAQNLGVMVGDKVTIHGPGNFREAMNELKKAEAKDPEARSVGEIRQMMRPMELEVTGLMETGRMDYDIEYFIIPIELAQQVYGFPGEVHAVSLKTADPYKVSETKRALQASLPREMAVTSWMDTNQGRLDAIANERTMMMFVLMIMVVVAAFSITNTLITVIVQKKREIGILKALGASRGAIVAVFLGQGAIVVVLGNIIGVALGFTVLALRDQIREGLIRFSGMDIFPAKIYLFAEIPAAITASDVTLICSASFVICMLAAAIPAFFAAGLDPVKALREE
ncbi:MAG: Lipoprotein-releasing system transrane protein LolE [Verrucomicrobiota bacterium]